MLGLDLHPAVVHFPIALGTTGAAAELVYVAFRKSWLKWFAPVLLTLALAGSGAAYFSGQSVEDKAEKQGIPEAPVQEHESSCIWAIGTLGLATLLSWATHSRGRGIWVAGLVAFVACVLTLYTGYLGGKLVYIHGAGRVSAATPAGAPASGAEGRESGEHGGEEAEHGSEGGD